MPRTKVGHTWNFRLSFRSDFTMYDQVEKLAAREGVTMAAMLRDIVDKGIKTRNSAAYRDKLFDDQ
jgi:predicted DNA-binding ribbon-helix-helix protein